MKHVNMGSSPSGPKRPNYEKIDCESTFNLDCCSNMQAVNIRSAIMFVVAGGLPGAHLTPFLLFPTWS